MVQTATSRAIAISADFDIEIVLRAKPLFQLMQLSGLKPGPISQKQLQQQRQKQIPFGNDNKKSEGQQEGQRQQEKQRKEQSYVVAA